jgi:hypothetical protein
MFLDESRTIGRGASPSKEESEPADPPKNLSSTSAFLRQISPVRVCDVAH